MLGIQLVTRKWHDESNARSLHENSAYSAGLRDRLVTAQCRIDPSLVVLYDPESKSGVSSSRYKSAAV